MVNDFPRRVRNPLALKSRVISAQLCPSYEAIQLEVRLSNYFRWSGRWSVERFDFYACFLRLGSEDFPASRLASFFSRSEPGSFRNDLPFVLSRGSHHADGQGISLGHIHANKFHARIPKGNTKETLRVRRSSLAIRRTAR